MWLDLLSAPSPARPAESPAPADACADASTAGLGGFVRFPGGQTVYFQQTLTAAELGRLVFPVCCPPAIYRLLRTSGTDCPCLVGSFSSAAQLSACARAYIAEESACWKGLSTAKGLCHLLWCFPRSQEGCRASAHINRNSLKDLADKLIRPSDPAQCSLP